MTARRQIPRVLLISPNRSLLRQVSRFLEMFGYPVTQAFSHERALDAIEAIEPSVVLIDDTLGPREYLEVCHSIRSHGVISEAFVMLVADDFSTNSLLQATASGFDDFLAKPLVHGELLARLRAAARLSSAARRDATYVDPLTGLIGRESFLQALEEHRKAAIRGGKPVACAVCGIDFLTKVNRLHGRKAGDEVIQRIATQLLDACSSGQTVGRIDGDLFAIALPGLGPEEARTWAEKLRGELALEPPESETTAPAVTVSIGVVADTGYSDEVNSESPTLLHRAMEVGRIAKQSGRDCVVNEGEFAEEDHILRNLAAPGRMFENTVARDVMTPCPIVLRSNDSTADALRLLRRSGSLGAPVAGNRGELLGFVSVEHLLEGCTQETSGGTLIETADFEAVAFESRTPFSELFEFFINRPHSEIVVVEDERPVGVITREGLTALVEPVRCRRNTPEDQRTRSEQIAAGIEATAS